MSLKLPKNTLAHFLARPLVVNRDISKLPLKMFTKAVQSYMGNMGGMASPDHEAVTFYCLNHIVAAFRQKWSAHEPLPAEVVSIMEHYDAVVSDQALRAMHYLILICTREARHCHAKPKMLTQFPGSAAAQFLQSGAHESGIHSELLNKTPNCTIGEYCMVLRWQFYKCSYSGGYGGPAWGAVADCLEALVNGKYTAEMMLDTNWTLAHNNGPIFNKGQLYGGYSQTLYRILDVQRAGMIPTACIHDAEIAGKTTATTLKVLKQALQIVPDLDFGGVDWKMVVKLGAKGSYKAELGEQKVESGFHQPGVIGTKPGFGPTKTKTKAPEFNPETHYQVKPGEWVAKIDRKKAA